MIPVRPLFSLSVCYTVYSVLVCYVPCFLCYKSSLLVCYALGGMKLYESNPLVPSSHQKLFNICKSFPCVLVPYSMNKYFLESIYIYHIGDTVDIYCLVIIPLTQVERSEDSLGYSNPVTLSL